MVDLSPVLRVTYLRLFVGIANVFGAAMLSSHE